jgi:hypothetical protein
MFSSVFFLYRCLKLFDILTQSMADHSMQMVCRNIARTGDVFKHVSLLICGKSTHLQVMKRRVSLVPLSSCQYGASLCYFFDTVGHIHSIASILSICSSRQRARPPEDCTFALELCAHFNQEMRGQESVGMIMERAPGVGSTPPCRFGLPGEGS